MQKIEYISIDKLMPHPANPRKDLGDLTELADSIKAKGILQNLTVVPYWSPVHKRIMAGIYTIIIGHRRHAAAKLAGLTELPCVVAEMTDKEQIETMAVENVQRSDLTAYEQAECFQMMLDMGSTVAEVSQKTGLSETTVRTRAKLTKLDKQKFKKAESRGATLTDFLKLNDIKDEERRNNVLTHLGTADFNQKYQSAIREEKDEKWLQDTIEAFRNASWCDELTAEQRDQLNNNKIRYVHNYGTHNKRVMEKPEDADRALYFFFVGSQQVDLYREIIKAEERKQEAEISQEKQERQRVSEEIDCLMAECEAREQEFRILRETFITEFDAFNTYREEIMAFMVKALMLRDKGNGYQWKTLVDRQELSNMLGIEYFEEKKQMASLDVIMRAQPERVLLYVAYLLLEDGNRMWLTKLYDNTVQTHLPKHREDKQLDLLYECLRSLGYAWSTEEQQAFGGLVPQFQRAEQLVEDFNEEWNHG